MTWKEGSYLRTPTAGCTHGPVPLGLDGSSLQDSRPWEGESPPEATRDTVGEAGSVPLGAQEDCFPHTWRGRA